MRYIFKSSPAQYCRAAFYEQLTKMKLCSWHSLVHYFDWIRFFSHWIKMIWYLVEKTTSLSLKMSFFCSSKQQRHTGLESEYMIFVCELLKMYRDVLLCCYKRQLLARIAVKDFFAFSYVSFISPSYRWCWQTRRRGKRFIFKPLQST